jgi:hypothetical protein
MIMNVQLEMEQPLFELEVKFLVKINLY